MIEGLFPADDAAGRSHIWAAFFLFLMVAAIESPARCRAADAAIDQTIESITVDELIDLMTDEGYAVEIHEAGFVQWKIEGYRCQVFVADNSEAIQFHISFGDGNATLKKINLWNATKRFSRTYLDDDGDPHLELDLDLAGGVTEGRIKDYLRTCKVSLAAWCKEVVE